MKGLVRAGWLVAALGAAWGAPGHAAAQDLGLARGEAAATYAWGTTELFTIPSGDGYDLPALWVLPPDFDNRLCDMQITQTMRSMEAQMNFADRATAKLMRSSSAESASACRPTVRPSSRAAPRSWPA